MLDHTGPRECSEQEKVTLLFLPPTFSFVFFSLSLSLSQSSSVVYFKYGRSFCIFSRCIKERKLALLGYPTEKRNGWPQIKKSQWPIPRLVTSFTEIVFTRVQLLQGRRSLCIVTNRHYVAVTAAVRFPFVAKLFLASSFLFIEIVALLSSINRIRLPSRQIKFYYDAGKY